MNTTNDKKVNINAVNLLKAKTEELINLVMRDRFYGLVSLELVVTDGIVRSIKTNISQNELIKKS
ncbi:MAG: hypothetical protein HYW14_04100 [Planctomycetes bacterium]|nr:hypothetical protein [Planctomycetota bacterium]MBI4008416.1 hypothetical protein [Planctomycetota bacterium]